MGFLRTSTALGCAAALSLAAACGSEGQEATTLRGAVAKVPAADTRTYAAADSAYGLKLLTARWGKERTANVVLSPSSLASGLGMVQLGARGQTATAMARTLALPAGDPVPGLHARNQAFKSFGGKDVTFTTTDQVWSDRRFKPD